MNMKLWGKFRLISIFIALTASAGAWAQKPAEPAPKSAAQPSPPWQRLFDGQTLKNWKPTNFGGEGEVGVDKGTMVLDFGSSLTGITYTAEFPKTDYEVRLEAMRVDGRDFFCGMT